MREASCGDVCIYITYDERGPQKSGHAGRGPGVGREVGACCITAILQKLEEFLRSGSFVD